MMFRSLIFAAFWCVFLGVMAAPLAAQTQEKPEEADAVPSTFDEKEKELLELIQRQMPQLNRIDSRLEIIAKDLKGWADILQYRKNIPRYREEALKDIARLRKENDRNYDALKELNMQWFRHTRHLMAVYTRFGEIRVKGKPTDQLKKFLARHREIMFKMEKLLVKVNDNYVDADFLLNTRLN